MYINYLECLLNYRLFGYYLRDCDFVDLEWILRICIFMNFFRLILGLYILWVVFFWSFGL